MTYIVNYSNEENLDWGFEECDTEEEAKELASDYQTKGYEILVEDKGY
jgi:hypothetical protein